MSKSTTRAVPAKDRKGFPLFPHSRGYWAKKVLSKTKYFGKIADDPDGEKALTLWLNQKDDLLAGREPRLASPEEKTVADICNEFLNSKRALLDAGEIAQRTFDELVATGQRVGAMFGRLTAAGQLTNDDFRRLRTNIAKDWGPVRLGNEIQRVRSIFKYAFDAGLIDRPPRYGADFNKPSAKVLRQNRAAGGLRMFERDELLAVLAVASVNAKAMILLGVNAGMGNGDVGKLPTSAVDLERGWINYARHKTGIERRFPLWPETIEALKAAKGIRPAVDDKQLSPLFFISRHRKGYADTHGYRVGSEMQLTLAKATIGKDKKPVARKGLSFYSLRHTFQTIAEGARDIAAVQSVMGHAASGSDMSATYRERVDDERLQAVVEHVRRWLFGVEKTGGTR